MKDDLERLIHWHMEHHPGFGPEDLAKLLFQGVLGMDHLLRDREKFLAQLEQDWKALEVPLPGEELFEPVSLDGRVVRLNLRPAKALGLSLAEIAPLLAGQRFKNGDLQELLRLWEQVLALARAGRIPLSPAALAPVGAALARGHPPGHSLPYRCLHRPAYRLLHDAPEAAARHLFQSRVGLTDLSDG